MLQGLRDNCRTNLTLSTYSYAARHPQVLPSLVTPLNPDCRTVLLGCQRLTAGDQFDFL